MTSSWSLILQLGVLHLLLLYVSEGFFNLLRTVMYAARTDVVPIFLGRFERLPGRLGFHNHFRYICNFNSLRGIRVSSYHIEC